MQTARRRRVYWRVAASHRFRTGLNNRLVVDSHGRHELVVHVPGKQRVLELAQVQLEHARHRVHFARVHRYQRVLALLERLLELVDLELRARYPKYALVVQTQPVDGLDAARDNGRYLLLGGADVLS